MEDRAPSHRLLFGGGASPGHVGGPRRESSRAGATLCPGPSCSLYSPKCVEKKGEFSEVRSSKRPTEIGSWHSRAAWQHLFGVETPRQSSVRCSVVYQGVATRNSTTS